MFKIIDEVCKPTRGSKYSACIDLYAREDIVIGAGETVKVPLGVCVDSDFFVYEIAKVDVDAGGRVTAGDRDKVTNFLKSHFLQLEPRSSLRAKGLQAGTGIIDLDYKDEIMIILHNPMSDFNIETGGLKTKYKISKGDRIAQIMLCEHKTYLLGVESDDERAGGFGSTGER